MMSIEQSLSNGHSSIRGALLVGSVCLFNRLLGSDQIMITVNSRGARALHKHLSGAKRNKLRADIRSAVDSLLCAALEETAQRSVEADMTLRGIKAESETEQGNCQHGKIAVSNTTLSM